MDIRSILHASKTPNLIPSIDACFLSNNPFPPPESTSSSSVCGQVFKKGDAVYACKQCGIDESSVLCSTCFKASDHTNHDISFTPGIGGCCDCGQKEAWTRPVVCSVHTPQTSNAVVVNSGELPLDAGMKDTISAVLDFVLEVMHDRSPRTLSDTAILSHDQGVGLSNLVGFIAGDTYVVMAWLANSTLQTPQEMSRVLGEIMCLGYSPNDEDGLLNISRVVSRILKHGRAVVMNTSDFFGAAVVANKLIELCETTAEANRPLMLVTVESRSKIEKEDICGELLDWLLSLHGRFPREAVAVDQITSDHVVHLINLELTRPANLLSSSMQRSASDLRIDEVTRELGEDVFKESGKELGIEGLLKLDWLIRFDSVLWKEAQLGLKQLYVSTLLQGRDEFRIILAHRFAANYLRISNAFFSCPSDFNDSFINFSGLCGGLMDSSAVYKAA
jgi:hypothetical protein